MTDNDARAYSAFVALAYRAKFQRGLKHWSARAAFHVLRWETPIVDGCPTFKINNNQSRSFAERAMQEHPELEGFFRMRSS